MNIKGRKNLLQVISIFLGGGIEYLEKQKEWKRLKQQTQHS